MNLEDVADRAQLASFGVDFKMPGAPLLNLVVFDMDEADPRWSKVRDWVEPWNPGDVVTTKFSKRELDAAEWLTIKALLYHGYPQPDEDDGYMELSYDLSQYCAECGIGMRQKAPLRMRGEPKWGKRGLIQMYWVWDELFVTPAVWANVFKPFGVGHREVLSRRGEVLGTVVQLVIDREAELDAADLQAAVCPRCGRARHDPADGGFAPPLAATPPGPLCRTAQWFGGGHQAFKRLLVSQALRRAILEAEVRGVGFRPLAKSDRL